jgi:hypothetical protein
LDSLEEKGSFVSLRAISTVDESCGVKISMNKYMDVSASNKLEQGTAPVVVEAAVAARQSGINIKI